MDGMGYWAYMIIFLFLFVLVLESGVFGFGTLARCRGIWMVFFFVG